MWVRRDGLQARVTALQGSSVQLTPTEREKLRKQQATYREAWVKRRRDCSNVVGEIADGMEKKTKEMFSLMGLETDEDEGVEVPPSVSAAAKPKPFIRIMSGGKLGVKLKKK